MTSPIKILILDDDQDILDFLKLKLSKAGHDTAVVLRPEDFFKKVLQFKPQVCLIDINLDGHQGLGYGIIELVRKKIGDEVKLMAMTRRNSPEDIEKAFEMGANDYIQKPIDELLLTNKLQALFGPNGGTSSLPYFKLTSSQSECSINFNLWVHSISEAKLILCSPNYLAKETYLELEGPLVDYLVTKGGKLKCFVKETELIREKGIYLFHSFFDTGDHFLLSKLRRVIIGFEKIN